ncbi:MULTISPECIES: hypothetical protein [Curtobacterium]|uniref:hypothetical protein n=1 Tax=Curtobacterium TaxID=2034 RepID=UPI0012F3683F|nr:MULTISPECIES: hypothetical protein [Curtobacterium]MCS6563815.1 hypothetical protein [Curtobacterium flaccumfaciens pv. flaccumfaciens]MCS6579027.1 hypothetical protein [Curtobacterium flaccumfaciens]MDD1386516.1 hypothetical protein [Curtobacterium flaccumfaciens pv. poinsettiae]UXZ57922.1 hypothetical protein MXD64_00645 [Curtobacterium sp. Arg-1]VXB33991.1 conserved membrane hypothetical protein [Curtobacterium sp. 8I-2]
MGRKTAGRRGSPPAGSRPARQLVTAAGLAYVANCLWGTAVAVRLIRTKKLRVVHHGLFVVTATLTGVAATTPVWTRDRTALFLLPALVPLAVAPRTNPRAGAHWRVAVAAAPSYLGAVLARRRSER